MGVLKKKKTPFVYYNECQNDQFWKQIKEEYGSTCDIYTKSIPSGLKLDILVIPPNEKGDYYKLITRGLGAYQMNIPRKYKKTINKRCELIMFLPKDWNITCEDIKYYWPIRQLKNLALIPFEQNTWLAPGLTVSYNADNIPYDKSTKFCSLMLLDSKNAVGDNVIINLNNIGDVNLYQVVPLYKEELKYKQKKGFNAFLKKINNYNDATILNNNRINFVANSKKKHE